MANQGHPGEIKSLVRCEVSFASFRESSGALSCWLRSALGQTKEDLRNRCVA
jgi:hypothetical protein